MAGVMKRSKLITHHLITHVHAYMSTCLVGNIYLLPKHVSYIYRSMKQNISHGSAAPALVWKIPKMAAIPTAKYRLGLVKTELLIFKRSA